MKDPIVKENKVIFGPCRLSYTHLLTKHSPDGESEGKYSTNIIIPKGEAKTVKAIESAIEAAKKAGLVSKWSGKEPKKLEMPLHEGEDKDDEVYANSFYLNAKSSTRPGVVDKFKNPITDEEEVYSGMWAYVSVTFFAYDKNGNKGIACGLNNVMKYKDDERLGGRVSAETDFANFEDDEDDDDKL